MSSPAGQSRDGSQGRVSFTLLEREYVLTCPEEERQLLLDAAELLREKMKEVRQGGKVIGGERVAVMAALHLAYEFIEYKSGKECYTEDVDGKVRLMLQKVQAALGTEGEESPSPEGDPITGGSRFPGGV